MITITWVMIDLDLGNMKKIDTHLFNSLEIYYVSVPFLRLLDVWFLWSDGSAYLKPLVEIMISIIIAGDSPTRAG